MADNLWYRLGFRANSTTPMLNTMAEIGTSNQARVPQMFLAPVDGDGNMDMTAIHSVDVSADGRPNGFYPTVQEAKTAVSETLQGQVGQIQVAIEAVNSYEEGAELKLAGASS